MIKREVWQRYMSVRNQLKKEIKKTKTLFYKKALSSKRLEEIWETILSQTRVKESPNKLNKTCQHNNCMTY